MHSLHVLPWVAILSGCVPSLGARAGAAVLSQPHSALGMSEASVAIGTQDLPILMGVATVQVGPSTHAYLGGAEINLPLARGMARHEYPQALWGRLRFDIGYRTTEQRFGATLGLTAGAGYPLVIIPNSNGDATHILKLNAEFRVFAESEIDVMSGINLEYIFVAQP